MLVKLETNWKRRMSVLKTPSSRTKNLKKKWMREYPSMLAFLHRLIWPTAWLKVKNTWMDLLEKCLGSGDERWCLQRRETSWHSELYYKESEAISLLCAMLVKLLLPSHARVTLKMWTKWWVSGRQHQERPTCLKSPHLFLPTRIMKNFERSNCSNQIAQIIKILWWARQ